MKESICIEHLQREYGMSVSSEYKKFVSEVDVKKIKHRVDLVREFRRWVARNTDRYTA